MPLYDYACGECGAQFEVRLSYAEADRAQPSCPQCQGNQTKRRILPIASRRSKQKGWLTREQMDAAVGLTEAALGGGGSDQGHDHAH